MTQFTKSDRGFKYFDEIQTDYGHKVEISESSRADGPCLWLWVDYTGSDLDGESEFGKRGVHLTASQARAVRDALNDALANHYQGDASVDEFDGE